MDGLERKFELLNFCSNFGDYRDHCDIVDLGICDSFLAHQHRIV